MEDFLNNFINGFFGGRPLYVYAICMVFAGLGAYIITYKRSKDGAKTSDYSPDKFNFWYSVFNNIKDMGFALTVAFSVFRFSNFWIENEAFLYLYAFLLGLCFNAVVIGIGEIEKNVSKKIIKSAKKSNNI